MEIDAEWNLAEAAVSAFAVVVDAVALSAAVTSAAVVSAAVSASVSAVVALVQARHTAVTSTARPSPNWQPALVWLQLISSNSCPALRWMLVVCLSTA